MKHQLKLRHILLLMTLFFVGGCGPSKAVKEMEAFCEIATTIRTSGQDVSLVDQQRQFVQSMMKMSLSSSGHKFITDLTSASYLDHTFFETYARDIGMEGYQCAPLRELFPKTR